jgi:hypothetical protein
VLADGYRTADIVGPGATVVGTAEMGRLVVKHLEQMETVHAA